MNKNDIPKEIYIKRGGKLNTYSINGGLVLQDPMYEKYIHESEVKEFEKKHGVGISYGIPSFPLILNQEIYLKRCLK